VKEPAAILIPQAILISQAMAATELRRGHPTKYQAGRLYFNGMVYETLLRAHSAPRGGSGMPGNLLRLVAFATHSRRNPGANTSRKNFA
jgi:hypothetical protein